MGDASKGPVSTMPGHRAELPTGATCDTHPGVIAVVRIQGETDSLGCEYIDMCQTCYDNDKAQSPFTEGRCDWCKTQHTDLRFRRDYEEGLSGRLYQVCGNCVRKENKELEEEEECYNNYYDDL